MKKAAWSFSALKTFETCPKKYWHEKIKKDVPFTETEASLYGKELHKAFELYIKSQKPLPLGMGHHAKALDRFAAMEGDKLTEVRLAINPQFEPVDYFAKDVWVRGQADLIIHNEDTAIVVDYKTGKVRPNFDQLDLMVALSMCLDSRITKAMGVFFWTKEKQITKKAYRRDDLAEIWNDYIPRAQRLDFAIAHDEFEARPNGLCARYCEVQSCPYQGK